MNGDGPTWKDYIDQGDATTRAQNEAKFSEVLAGLDKVNSSLSAHGQVVLTRFDTIDGEISEAKTAAKEAKAAAAEIKWHIFFTGLTIAALAYGAFALWGQAVEMTTGILGN